MLLTDPVAVFALKLIPGSLGVRLSCGPASAACARRRPANHASASAAWRMAFSRSCTAVPLALLPTWLAANAQFAKAGCTPTYASRVR